MKLTDLPITYHQTIPQDYEDIMGHMNVMWYTHLFDQATFAFFEMFGFGASYLRRTGNGSFAVEAHVQYLSEVRIGANITIWTRALGRGDKTIHFMHFMSLEESDKLAATTEIIGVHIDLHQRRGTPFPTEIIQELDEMIAKHDKLDWSAPVCGVMKA
jgi:acyl-CoA thioester hydrolase